MEKQKKKQMWSKTGKHNVTSVISKKSKDSKDTTNKQTGITLIALVILIIVMLILAGISLNMTVGENGIITKAQEAKLAQEDAEWNEKAEMIMIEALANKDKIETLTEEQIAEAGNDEAKIQEFKIENMRKYLQKQFQQMSENDVIVSASGAGYIVVDGERVYTVDKDFKQGINVIAKKMLVETAENWLFAPNSDGTCVINACNKELEGTIVIPAVLVDREEGNAYIVTGIGNDVFNYATRVTRVDFSKVGTNLKTIGARAFAFCVNLEINMPEDLPSSITSIGDKAFYGCTKLQGNINTIISQNYELGKGVFMKCPNLTGEIQGVFNQNFYLDESGNPSSTVIEEGQFSGYTGLTGDLIIPNYITSIEDNAFYGCLGMTGLYFEEGSKCTNIGKYAFYECNKINNNLVLPNSITSVKDYAFSKSGITGLVLPSAITELGSATFKECSSLAGTVTFPATLESISSSCFYSCKLLTSINFNTENNEGVKSISELAFYYTGLISISFSSPLVTIGKSSFMNCYSLTNVNFPNSLENIVSYAFYGDRNLQNITWPSSLKKIGSFAFVVCNIHNLPDKLDNLVSIGESAFSECENLEYNLGNGIDIIEWIKSSKITSLGNSCFKRLSIFKRNLFRWKYYKK